MSSEKTSPGKNIKDPLLGKDKSGEESDSSSSSSTGGQDVLKVKQGHDVQGQDHGQGQSTKNRDKSHDDGQQSKAKEDTTMISMNGQSPKVEEDRDHCDQGQKVTGHKRDGSFSSTSLKGREVAEVTFGPLVSRSYDIFPIVSME